MRPTLVFTLSNAIRFYSTAVEHWWHWLLVKLYDYCAPIYIFTLADIFTCQGA